MSMSSTWYAVISLKMMSIARRTSVVKKIYMFALAYLCDSSFVPRLLRMNAICQGSLTYPTNSSIVVRKCQAGNHELYVGSIIMF